MGELYLKFIYNKYIYIGVLWKSLIHFLVWNNAFKCLLALIDFALEAARLNAPETLHPVLSYYSNQIENTDLYSLSDTCLF